MTSIHSPPRTPSTQRSSKNLPSWAKLIPQRNPKPQTPATVHHHHHGDRHSDNNDEIPRHQLQQEEAHLRSVAYLTTSDILDRAYQVVLRRHMFDCITHPLAQFLDLNLCDVDDKVKVVETAASERKDDPLSAEESAAIATCESLVGRWSQSAPLPPQVLPLGIVQCPPSVLDRREMAMELRRSFVSRHTSSSNKRTHTRTVWNPIQGSRDGGREMTHSRKRIRSWEEDMEQETDGRAGGDGIQHTMRSRPAICLLRHVERKSSSNGNQHHHGIYLRDIILQCIQQETNPQQFDALTSKIEKGGRGTATGHCVDHIVEWASFTVEFSSIVVLFENPELMSLATLNAFLGSLTSLRFQHGVPISIVFMTTSPNWSRNQLSSLDPSCLFGESGMRLREFHALSNHDLFFNLLDCLFFHDDTDDEMGGGAGLMDCSSTSCSLPVLLPGTVLRKVRELFLDQHGSVVTAVRQMKMAFAHHFTQKGTFLGLIQNKQFLDKVGKHVAWFCLDPHARSDLLGTIMTDDDLDGLQEDMDSRAFLEKLQSAAVDKSFICLTAKLVGIAREQKQGPSLQSSTSTHMLEHCLMKSREYALTLRHYIFRVCRKGTLLELLTLFSKWIHATKTHLEKCSRIDLTNQLGSSIWEESRVSLKMDKFVVDNNKRTISLLQFLQESLILLNDLNHSKVDADEKRSSCESDFRQYLVVRLKEVTWDTLLDWDRLSKSPFMVFGHHAADLEMCLMYSLQAEPRKWIASALSNVPKHSEEFVQHSLDTATAFTTFDRRVISMKDWFDGFYGKIEFDEKDDEKTLLMRFASSVYQLMYCGFVTHSTRRDDHFEKEAIVFAAYEN